MKKDLFNLKDKIIIITGGCGQIGQEFTKILTQYGAKVAIFDIENKSLEINNKNIFFYKVDITKKQQIVNALEKVKQEIGIPTGLINNAALDFPPNSAGDVTGPFENISEETYDKIMEVNVKGIFMCCQIIGGEFAKNNNGTIVNMCSIYGLLSPRPDIYDYKNVDGKEWYKPSLYSISKASLLNLTRYLAVYWAKKKVRVNCLTPAGIFNNQDKEFLYNYEKNIPIGRMANVQELDGAIVYLMSDSSTYYTGANLIVDGGWTAW